MTELRNKHKIIKDYTLLISSDLAEINEQGKCVDPGGGVSIMLAPRMKTKIHDSECVGTRIVWVR